MNAFQVVLWFLAGVGALVVVIAIALVTRIINRVLEHFYSDPSHRPALERLEMKLIGITCFFVGGTSIIFRSPLTAWLNDDTDRELSAWAAKQNGTNENVWGQLLSGIRVEGSLMLTIFTIICFAAGIAAFRQATRKHR